MKPTVITVLLVMLCLTIGILALPSRLNEIHNASHNDISKPAVVGTPTTPPSTPTAADDKDKKFFAHPTVPIAVEKPTTEPTTPAIVPTDKDKTAITHPDGSTAGTVTHYEIRTDEGIIDINCEVLKDVTKKEGGWEYSLRESACIIAPRDDDDDSDDDMKDKAKMHEKKSQLPHDAHKIDQNVNKPAEKDKKKDEVVLDSANQTHGVITHAVEDETTREKSKDETIGEKPKDTRKWYDKAIDGVTGAWHKSKDATTGAWDSTKGKFKEIGEKFKHDHRDDPKDGTIAQEPSNEPVKAEVKAEDNKTVHTLHHKPGHHGDHCDKGDLQCEQFEKQLKHAREAAAKRRPEVHHERDQVKHHHHDINTDKAHDKTKIDPIHKDEHKIHPLGSSEAHYHRDVTEHLNRHNRSQKQPRAPDEKPIFHPIAEKP